MASELTTRTISGVILGTVVIALTYWSFESFALMCLVGAVILAKEWWGLTKHRSRWWVLVGSIYIGAAIAILLLLHYVDYDRIHGRQYLMLKLYAIVWGCDTVAYLVGKRFGKHKIAPRISPGKSWEGLAAAFAWCCFLTLLDFSWERAFPDTRDPTLVDAAVFCIIAGGFAVAGLMGDMFESYLKRKAGVKDSSTFIPGHGGLFDRVDALLASALYYPLFVLLTAWYMFGTGLAYI